MQTSLLYIQQCCDLNKTEQLKSALCGSKCNISVHEVT